MFDRVARPRVLPFLVYIAFILVADLLARAGVDAQQLRWLYPLKIAAVLALLLKYRRDYVELPRFNLNLRDVAVAVGAGVLVLVLWVSLDASWMLVGKPAGFDPRDAGRINSLLVAVRLFGAALVVPVMEELFWRSFLSRWIDSPHFLDADPAKIKFQTLVATVILFGIEHSQWLAGMMAGLVYGVLYCRSRSLWSPVLAHATTNSVLGVWIIVTEQWTYW